MSHAYLKAPMMPTMSAQMTCVKIPMARTEANRMARGKPRNAEYAKRSLNMGQQDMAYMNAYRCVLCGYWHIGHLFP